MEGEDGMARVIFYALMLTRAICMRVCIREGHGKSLSARSALLRLGMRSMVAF